VTSLAGPKKTKGAQAESALRPKTSTSTRGKKMDKTQSSHARDRKDSRHEFLKYIEEIKNRADIFQVAAACGLNVNKYGQSDCFNGHDNKTPSLQFYNDTQAYYCFGCGANGDAISLVQHLDQCSFMDALNRLAQETGIKPYQGNNGFDPEIYARVSGCLQIAGDIYHGWLKPDDEYLKHRGISYEIARQFLIGRTRGRDDLQHALEAKGIDSYTMLQSGLVKTDGTDFFHNHIVVPVMRSGRVVDFYGRSLNGNDGRRHWRLPNDRYQVGHALFNWNPRAEEIILVEGIFDALALIQNGFKDAVAALGTNGLNDQTLTTISRSLSQRVFVCYDGEPRAQQAALKHANLIEEAGKEVRIIDLPDSQDPWDYFQDHSAQDFQQLMDSSLLPFDCELRHISELESREDQLKRIRDELLPRVKRADPTMQPDRIKKIHSKFGVPVKALNEQLKRIDVDSECLADAAAVEDAGTLLTISPALDLVDGTMIIMAPRRIIRGDSQIPRWQNTVVTSDRERLILTHEELLQKGWYAPALEQTDIQVAEERYSADVINGFLSGHLQGDLARTFSEIRQIIRWYIDFSDDRVYDYLACWIIGTYFYPIFSHYPYVHFTGPKGSGKSQCLYVLRCLCHNAKIAGSMSLAVQFRIIGALQPSLLFDEMENLGQTQHTELHRMLKYGFEKNGPQVWRMDMTGTTMQMSWWNVYCPRSFASIEGMEDVIGSRSVQIIMERSFDDQIKGRTVNSEDPSWQQVRDRLFLVTLTEGARIKEIHDSLQKPPQIYFSGRDWDIFKGVMTVATAVGTDVFTRLLSFAVDTHEARIAKDHDNSPDMIILKYLSEAVTREDWYELGQLNEGLTQMAGSQGLDLQGRMTRDRLGKRIATLKLFEETKRGALNGRKVTLYRMNPYVIAKKLENHLRG